MRTTNEFPASCDREPPLINGPAALTFSRAWSDADFEQIYRLNHRTFVDEIPQHQAETDGRLVDERLARSTCFVAKRAGELVGMLALSTHRPFSLDHKVDDLDALLPCHLISSKKQAAGMCEVRLLAIEPRERTGVVFAGLMRVVLKFAGAESLNCAVISATTRQLKLYRRFGFKEFGPPLGTSDAAYQGMVIDWTSLGSGPRRLIDDKKSLNVAKTSEDSHINLLPGPVDVHPTVHQSLSEPPLSHRGTRFRQLFAETQDRLLALTKARAVQIIPGSGTLANDVVAAQLAATGQPGLIVTSGEFGHRLLGHAAGARLEHRTIKGTYGRDLNYAAIDQHLLQHPSTSWMWLTHCETSSGVIHRLPRLLRLCRRHQVRLVLDCISSIGVVPLDLSGVFLASGTSGKALGSFAGLALVFHSEEPQRAHIPPALDLGAYANSGGVAFTIPTNQVRALCAAVNRFSHDTRPIEARLEQRTAAATELRIGLREHGFEIVACDREASPAVTTVRLPEGFDSREVGDRLFDHGFRVSYQSQYLARRNEIQFCFMSESQPDIASTLPLLLATICSDIRLAQAPKQTGSSLSTS